MKRILTVTISLLSITGCGGPESGDYTVTSELISDSCSLFEDEPFEDETWSVLFEDDNTVSITSEDDSETTCSMSGSTAVCEISASEDMDDMNAALITEVSFNLNWDSNTTFSGSTEVYWSCLGDDCGALGEFIVLPCDASVDVSGVLTE